MGERRRLIHFGTEHLTVVRSEKQGERYGGAYKPNGLWVSVEGGKSFGWRAWCKAESWGNIENAKQTEIVLRPDARVLRLRTVRQLDEFTERYGRQGYTREPDWSALAKEFQGIVIAPYQWSRRLSDKTRWYYSWDCASGCIWDAAAIDSLHALIANQTQESA